MNNQKKIDTDSLDYNMKMELPIYIFIKELKNKLPLTIDATGNCIYIYKNIVHNIYYASSIAPNGSEHYTGNDIGWNYDAVRVRLQNTTV